MQTRVTGLLKTEYPIIQGGMAWVADYHLAAAVSNGGGLGMIGAANAPAEWVAEQIREVRKRTDRPFGVNIMLMSPHADEVARTVARERVPFVPCAAGCRTGLFGVDHSDRRRCSRLYDAAAGA